MKKVFIRLTPGVNVIKLFSFVANDEAEKARVFVPGHPLHLTFASNTKKEASERCSNWVGFGFALKF
jgi:hypothetical protein